MRIARLNHTAIVLTLLVGIHFGIPRILNAAGVTVLTHGWNSSTTSWVEGMATALSNRFGGDVIIYRITVTNPGSGLVTAITSFSGGDPLTTTSGELILMLDWGDVSTDSSTTTFDVANVVAPLFGQTNLIGELGGHALAEFPIHLAGHSRGGSLVCELSKKLGQQGIWVDQVTGLDAELRDNNDAPAWSYDNTLFSDSYYQEIGWIQGNEVLGSFSRKQTEVDGGYYGIFGSLNGHSDIHLWYHGTIDLNTPASNNDGESITSAMRDTWWTVVEERGTNAGFIYTHQGGGDRFSTNRPNGSNSSPIRDGFNRYHDVGGGAGDNNRTAVGSNTGEWPNPIRFDLLTTNQVQQGDTATFGIHFQWAQPTNETQIVEVFADPDRNPWNGNEVLLEDGTASGTTVAQVGYGTLDVNLDGTLVGAGDHEVLVRMKAAGRTRYLYAQQTLALTTGTHPFTLDITGSTNSNVTLGVNGTIGQTAVLESSVDGLPWLPVATNTLTSARWEILEPIDPAATMTLFRALLVTP